MVEPLGTEALGALDEEVPFGLPLIVGSPEFETPSLSQHHIIVASDLIVASPELEDGTGFLELTPCDAEDFVVGSPDFDTPLMFQLQVIIPGDFTVYPPSFWLTFRATAS